MTRYTSSRHYLVFGLAALAGALVSAWFTMRWLPSIVPAILLLVAGATSLTLYVSPSIEVHAHELRIGRRRYAWSEVRAVDRILVTPLVVVFRFADNSARTLIFAGDLVTSNRLLRQIRRAAREALIDGVPYSEFWAEPAMSAAIAPSAIEGIKERTSPRYPVLRKEDEAEVERLYQRLKTVGHLDSRGDDN